MRINCTLSLGLDVFLFVTADNHRSAPRRLRRITEGTDNERDWGQGQPDWRESERQCWGEEGEGQRQQD